MAEYEPGQCNIGPRERRKRRLLGFASLIGGVAYVVAVVAIEWPPIALLAAFPFAFGAALGLLQDRAEFCVGFAITERYDRSDAGGTAGRVRNAAAVKADRLRAGRLVARAIGLALVVTLAAFGAGLLVL